MQEVILTLQMERHFMKDEIFEMYLNKIYFGQGAYGIQSAAQIYFGKDLKTDELTLEEAATEISRVMEEWARCER